MPEYRYEAVNDAGKKLEGTMTAESIKEVITKIMMSRYYPTRIEELSQQGSIQYQRLDRLKQIRNFVVPQPEPIPEGMPVIKHHKPRYLIILAIMIWALMLIIYLVSQAHP